MFEEAETSWQQNRWALCFMLVCANPPVGTQIAGLSGSSHYGGGKYKGMTQVVLFLPYMQRNIRRRRRTRLWRNWPLRWSKTCRWRSAASTFATKTTWVSAGRGTRASARLVLLSWDRFLFQLSDPQNPVCVGLTLSEMSLQVNARTRTPVHTQAHNVTPVLCFRPPMKTGTPASWMKRPRSFIRWRSINQLYLLL